MNGVFLLLGSNQAERELNLKQAKEKICSGLGRLIKASAVYETAAWGYTNQASFLNQVLHIECSIPPMELLDSILEIERELGRIRTADNRWKERVIDIDILYYGQQILKEEKLILPHPRIAERRFVLVPMAEIAPFFIHPVLKHNQKKLLESCPDKLEVIKK